MKNFKKVAILALAFTPAVAFAQNAGQLFALLQILRDVLSYLMPVLIILGVLYVAWGIISFVIKTNEEERAKAKGQILYGIIGLFVVVSMWGLVAFLQTTLGIRGGNLDADQVPCVIDANPNLAGCQ